MTTVNVHDAKTQLSRLLKEVEAGGEVVISRAGKPVARLVPMAGTERPKRQFGRLRDMGAVDDRFFEPLPEEELRRWEGSAGAD